jgi:hypothetical protein
MDVLAQVSNSTNPCRTVSNTPNRLPKLNTRVRFPSSAP